MSLGQKELQALSQSVQHASDRTIIQVVAAIDSIENRGDADTLLVPLRGRIAGLKIKRPLTLRRLTYEPLEPLIVDTTAWVSGQPAVPRSALSSLFEMIKAASPDMPDWEQLAAKAQINRRMREELGLRLWGRGAQVLVQAGMPARWPDMTGLSAEDFNRIAGIVALVLSQAARSALARTVAPVSLAIAAVSPTWSAWPCDSSTRSVPPNERGEMPASKIKPSSGICSDV